MKEPLYEVKLVKYETTAAGFYEECRELLKSRANVDIDSYTGGYDCWTNAVELRVDQKHKNGKREIINMQPFDFSYDYGGHEETFYINFEEDGFGYMYAMRRPVTE